MSNPIAIDVEQVEALHAALATARAEVEQARREREEWRHEAASNAAKLETEAALRSQITGLRQVEGLRKQVVTDALGLPAPSVSSEPEPVTLAEAIPPCPFCGGVGEMSRSRRFPGCPDDWPGAWSYVVSCTSCAATGGWAKSASGAKKWWSRRLAAAHEPAREAGRAWAENLRDRLVTTAHSVTGMFPRSLDDARVTAITYHAAPLPARDLADPSWLALNTAAQEMLDAAVERWREMQESDASVVRPTDAEK